MYAAHEVGCRFALLITNQPDMIFVNGSDHITMIVLYLDRPVSPADIKPLELIKDIINVLSKEVRTYISLRVIFQYSIEILPLKQCQPL